MSENHDEIRLADRIREEVLGWLPDSVRRMVEVLTGKDATGRELPGDFLQRLRAVFGAPEGGDPGAQSEQGTGAMPSPNPTNSSPPKGEVTLPEQLGPQTPPLRPRPRRRERLPSRNVGQIETRFLSGKAAPLLRALDSRLCGGQGRLPAVEAWIAFKENSGRFGPNAPRGDGGVAIRGFQWNDGTLAGSKAKFERSLSAGMDLYAKYVGNPPDRSELDEAEEDVIAHLGFVGEDKLGAIGNVERPSEIADLIVRKIQVCTPKALPYYAEQAERSNLFA